MQGTTNSYEFLAWYERLLYDYDVVLPYKVAKVGPYATVLHTRFPYYTIRNRLDRFCCFRAWIRHRFAGWRQIWAEILTTDGGKLQKKSHIINPLFDSLARNTGRYFTREELVKYRLVLRAKLSNKVYVVYWLCSTTTPRLQCNNKKEQEKIARSKYGIHRAHLHVAVPVHSSPIYAFWKNGRWSKALGLGILTSKAK